MIEFVEYNGVTMYACNCTGNVRELKSGEKYRVISENKNPWNITYILKNLEGEFNSFWFNEASDDA